MPPFWPEGKSTRAEILGIRKKLSGQIGGEHSDIFNAHLLILEDRTLIEDVIGHIKVQHFSSEHAFSTVIQNQQVGIKNIRMFTADLTR